MKPARVCSTRRRCRRADTTSVLDLHFELAPLNPMTRGYLLVGQLVDTERSEEEIDWAVANVPD